MSTVESRLEKTQSDIIATARSLRTQKNISAWRAFGELSSIEVSDFLINSNYIWTVLSESVEFGATEVDHRLVECIVLIKEINQGLIRQYQHGAWMAGQEVKS